MPPTGKEVQLSQIEIDLMSVFVKHRVFKDRHAAIVLLNLMYKLEGTYANSEKTYPLRDKEDRIQ
jgi:hypothetical protein